LRVGATQRPRLRRPGFGFWTEAVIVPASLSLTTIWSLVPFLFSFSVVIRGAVLSGAGRGGVAIGVVAGGAGASRPVISAILTPCSSETHSVPPGPAAM